MNFVKKALLLVLKPECYDEYFIKFNFMDGACFAATLSKLLGIALIIMSIGVKLPQIMKIVKNRSSAGISIVSVTLDLTAIMIYMSYSFIRGFPFSAWGDVAFLAVQTIVIGVLVLFYQEMRLKAVAYLVIYLAASYVLMGGITPVDVLWTLQGFNIPILLTGKLTQALVNYKNGNTGQLSAITLFIMLFGTLARIFTSIQETGDAMVIITYVASSSANAVLVFQLLYYWNVDISKRKKD